jgi:hypothetical protein
MERGHRVLGYGSLNYPARSAAQGRSSQIAWHHKLLRSVTGIRAALHGVIWVIKMDLIQGAVKGRKGEFH